MALVLTSAPAIEPVTLSEAKAHLRIDGSGEDTLLGSLILTSRLHVETALGLALITQTWRLLLDAWPTGEVLELPLRPLQSVDEVRIIAASGDASVVPETDWRADLASTPPRLLRAGAGWPPPGVAAGGIAIDLTAGYGDAAADVPAPIRQALLLLIAHWYENREPRVSGEAIAIPGEVSALLAPYRSVRL